MRTLFLIEQICKYLLNYFIKFDKKETMIKHTFNYTVIVFFAFAFFALSCKKSKTKAEDNTCIVGKWKYIGAESNGNFIPVDTYDHYTFYANENNRGQFSYDYVTIDTSYVILTGSYHINGNKLELFFPYNSKTDTFEMICNDSILKLGPPISINYYNILERD